MKRVKLSKNKYSLDSRQRYIGSSLDKQVAATIYDTFAKKHFGQFARLNSGTAE